MDDRLTFDPDAFELFRNGQIVDIEPQALTVAAYLIEHRHRLVPKEELLDEIWGDRFVSESALTTRIKQIRRAMGDDGTEQRVVKTIHGKGYRFVGEIKTVSARSDDERREFDGNGDGDGDGNRPMVHNLPRLRTGVFGRGPEMELAASTISHNRLTTMVGVGGVGKTTLAIATGHEMLDSFPQGVCFVDLTTVSHADQLPLAIAKAAGLSLETGNALDQVAQIVGGRNMLFVLDNCEHVLDAVAETIDRLLDMTSAPRFLLTSREPLSLPDEARVLVTTLPTDSDGPAVQLLGACAARYGFADFDRSTAADVCRELDGLPLAIELAAAQLRHLSLDDLAVRLDQRLDLLVDPRRNRHSSLATVLEATWAAIENPEREVLRQLAACPGALSLGDLIEIMDQPESETLNALGRLVDCSLLIRSMDRVGEYRMLETVRVFARDDDGDMQPQRRERLATWCLEHVGTSVVTHAFDFGLAEWCRAHEDLLDAAEAHLAADRPDDAAMLVAAQGLALHLDDGSRAADLITRLDQHLDRIEEPALRARVHITGAFGAMAARGPTELAAHGTAAVEEARRCGDPSILGISLVLESWSAIRDSDRALELVDEAATVAEMSGDHRTFNLSEGYRAWHLTLARRYDEAERVARHVLERAAPHHGYDTFCAAASLATCRALADPREALEVYERFLNQPGPAKMMANELLLATIHAADAAVIPTARIVTLVHDRVVRAGAQALPDLLVPMAALADSVGDADRARVYIAAVRTSSRPTQSLQATCLYQQLRARVDDADADAEDDHENSSDATGRDALDWLTALAENS